jgi:hypothetical protein
VQQLAQQASEQARQAAERQKGSLAESVVSVARALESTASQLENERQDAFARVAHDAANRLHGLSSSLRDKDVDRLRIDAEDFARARPALFLGGCVALGFALSRFLKASSSRPEASEASEEGEQGEAAQDAMNAADPAVGVHSEIAFDEPAREPVTSEWSAERIESTMTAVSAGDPEYKP